MSGRSSGGGCSGWDAPGPDTCEGCGAAFHAEIGYYCHQCDACLCPICVTVHRVTRVVICADCETLEGES